MVISCTNSVLVQDELCGGNGISGEVAQTATWPCIKTHRVICCTFARKLLLTCDFRTKSNTYACVLWSKVDEWWAIWADCQNLHASSVMANYNWQRMLESGQAQTEASWQNNPDHQCVPKNWTLPCNQHTPWGQSPPLLMPYLKGSQSYSLSHTAAPAINESHNSSEGPDTLMSLYSSQPFVTDSTGPLGSSQSVGSGTGSLLFRVVMHGSN